MRRFPRLLSAFAHELAEAMTDPEGLSAWTDIYGQEIADDCVLGCVALTNGSYTLNRLVSDAVHGCAP